MMEPKMQKKIVNDNSTREARAVPKVVYETTFEHNDQTVHVNGRDDGMIVLYLVNELMPRHRIHLHMQTNTLGTYDNNYPEFEQDLIQYIKNNTDLDSFTANAPASFAALAQMIAEREAELLSTGVINEAGDHIHDQEV